MAISTYATYLMYKTGTPPAYAKLVDIKDFPDLFGAPDTLETTTLSDPARTYILGIQNQDALEFTINYTKADFAKLKALEGEEQDFAIYFGDTDGTDGIYEFKGLLSVSINGGGVNEVVESTITIAPTTVITVGS